MFNITNRIFCLYAKFKSIPRDSVKFKIEYFTRKKSFFLRFHKNICILANIVEGIDNYKTLTSKMAKKICLV